MNKRGAAAVRRGMVKWLATFVLLAGCGGAPFTFSQELVRDDAGGEGGDEKAPDDAGRGGSHDARGADENSTSDSDCCSNPTQACKGGCADASLEADAPAESCALMPPDVGQRPYACAFGDAGGTSPIPATFAWQSMTACGYAATPPECQCAGAFDCACLRAAQVCTGITGGTLAACDDQATNMPEVTCN